MKYAIPALAACGAVLLIAAESHVATAPVLTAHEWGTFTSIAGNDGMAVNWEPLDGPTDLPCFVHRFEFGAKALFSGTVRMETPVIYLYGPEGSTASVRVGVVAVSRMPASRRFNPPKCPIAAETTASRPTSTSSPMIARSRRLTRTRATCY